MTISEQEKLYLKTLIYNLSYKKKILSGYKRLSFTQKLLDAKAIGQLIVKLILLKSNSNLKTFSLYKPSNSSNNHNLIIDLQHAKLFSYNSCAKG
ncbi:unnamed protein product [Commensalibacter papalotli (ex Botero et al. 2024)]|nr:unnamed protein product [Commensalibacter papalotli (ex Botero et al. 2024)]